LRRRSVETLQVNLGYRCNQSCLHCHVNAGPQRKEEMTAETIDALTRLPGRQPRSQARST
jgi:MoaA/NifB/PqqE/SkfB family radical SAM enzyme